MVRIERCSVKSCMAKRNPDENISLHKLPRDEKASDAWNKFLKAANGSSYQNLKKSWICSHHFLSDCIETGPLSRIFITPGHIPSILNGLQIPNQPCQKCTSHELNHFEITVESNGGGVSNFEGQNIAKSAQVSEGTKELNILQLQILSLQEELKQLPSLRTALQESQKEIKRLKMQLSRRTVTLKRKSEASMCEKVDAKKPKVDSEVQTDYTFGNIPKADLLFEMIGRKSKNLPYTEEQRDFTFVMHYHSPRVYKEFRESLANCLPDPHTFTKWTNSVDSKPGILRDAVSYIRESNEEEQVHYSLAFDELAVRRHIGVCKGKVTGHIDYGGITEECQPKKEARNALFCLATEINGSKSFPIAYMLTNGIKAKSLKDFIEICVKTVREAGGIVTNITFDGHRSNFGAAKLLGANLTGNSPDFKPFFELPESESKVYIIPDPSHMFKLLRNAWKRVGTIVDMHGKEIKWKYITVLDKLQTESGFRAANKLSIRHVNFEQQKMKTKLAVQVTSNSVATALEVCRILKVPDFEESEATVTFLRMFDRLFDFLNSKPCGKGFKGPVSLNNVEVWGPFIEHAKDYLLGLKMRNAYGILVPAMDHPLGTFVKGIFAGICCIEAIIYEYCGEGSQLRFLPGFKLGQDNLELYNRITNRIRRGCKTWIPKK